MKTTILMMVLACPWTPWAACGEGPLQQAFTRPPPEARPWCYWYWMNGNVTREGIIADLQAMHDVGVGGVFLMDIGIHPAGPVAYHSPQWYELGETGRERGPETRHPGQLPLPRLVGQRRAVGHAGDGDAGTDVVRDARRRRTGTGRDAASAADEAGLLPRHRRAGVSHARRRRLDATRPQADNSGYQTGKPVRNAAAAFDGDTNTAATLPEQFELVFDRPIPARTIFIRAARANGGFSAKLHGLGRGPRHVSPGRPGSVPILRDHSPHRSVPRRFRR